MGKETVTDEQTVSEEVRKEQIEAEGRVGEGKRRRLALNRRLGCPAKHLRRIVDPGPCAVRQVPRQLTFSAAHVENGHCSLGEQALRDALVDVASKGVPPQDRAR